MNPHLLLVSCIFLVEASGWLERSRSQQQWPHYQVYGETTPNSYYWPSKYGRVQRGTSDDNPRFSVDRVRSDLNAAELNFYCFTYQTCNYEGGFTFLTKYENNEPAQLHYFLAMKGKIQQHHGEKFFTDRKESEATVRLEKKQKLQELISILLGSWTNLLNQFLKLELPERHLSEMFLDFFSRIVEIGRLDDTLKRAEKVLRLFPSQFLSQAGKDFLNPTYAGPSEVNNQDSLVNDFHARNYHKRSYGYRVGRQGQFGSQRRLRRSTTREINTSFVKEQTIANATFIMSEVFVYIFESHPKLFSDALHFLKDTNIAYTDTSLLAFKRILSDSYVDILKEKKIAHGDIVTKLREDMFENMVPLDNYFKKYWADQQYIYTRVPTSEFVKKAEEETKNFLSVYVWIQSFKQVEDAYTRLEQLKEEIDNGPNDELSEK